MTTAALDGISRAVTDTCQTCHGLLPAFPPGRRLRFCETCGLPNAKPKTDVNEIVSTDGGASPRKEARFHLRALIDGVSSLYIKGTRLWWCHVSERVPGGRDVPTWINGAHWFPAWLSKGNLSAPKEIEPIGLNASLKTIQARGKVRLSRVPPDLLVLDFDDGGLMGAEWYEIELRW